MTATMTAPGLTIIDERPLKDRLSEALKERDAAHKALITVGTLMGGAAGAGIGYINHLIAIAFYSWIGMPAWFMTVATWSGYFSIGYLAIVGAWLVYSFAND